MSKKTKASSKNKKAPVKKVAKKSAPKKVVVKKKTTKPVAKAKPVKKATAKTKTAPKKVVAKKPVKKVAAKKVIKKAPVKKVVAKKVTAKKPVVKAKTVAKKAVVKAKPVKAAPKKVAVKTKPVVAKKVEKVAPVKAKDVKAAKPVAEKVVKQKVAKPAPAPVKKQIVAPTTYRVDDANIKPVKEPAGKFEMEFVVRASEDMVYEFVSTESGLSEWFCDDVNIRNGIFTFTWDGQTQQARLVKENPPFFIRYQWLDKNDGSYFEFKTQKDELTNDISLIITDFAESKADEESARLLWASQIDKLLHVLGSFF